MTLSSRFCFPALSVWLCSGACVLLLSCSPCSSFLKVVPDPLDKRSGKCQSYKADQRAKKPCNTRCGFNGQCGGTPKKCVAVSNVDCKKSGGCSSSGNCAKLGDYCGPKTAAHCAQSTACKREGLCGIVRNRCVPTQSSHCLGSNWCKKSDKCHLINKKCRRKSG